MRYYLPIPLIFNFFFFFQWFFLANTTFQYRFPKTVTWMAELATFALNIYLGSTLPYFSFIRLMYLPILHMAAFLILLRGRWQKIVFVVAMLWLIQYITEILGAVFIYTPEDLAGHLDERPIFAQLRVYFFLTLISSVLNISLYLLINRVKLRLSVKQYLLCTAFLFMQLGILFGYMREISLNPNADKVMYLTFSIVSCVVMDTFLIQYVINSNRREQLQAENQLLSTQIEEQKSRYTAVAAEYEAVRRMRHDIAKHLNTMEHLLQGGHRQEASVYISELRSNMYSDVKEICEHPIADALLSSYQERARREKILLCLNVQLPYPLGIADTDLICALGNLLDNAFEATALLEQPRIQLSCAVAKGYLVVSVENGYTVSSEKLYNISELERGIGTKILNHIAEKYHGVYSTQCDDTRFCARLSLKPEEVSNDSCCSV